MLDRKTREVIKDCGGCGCGNSKNQGNHSYRKTGEVLRVGKMMFETSKCTRCGTYKT